MSHRSACVAEVGAFPETWGQDLVGVEGGDDGNISVERQTDVRATSVRVAVTRGGVGVLVVLWDGVHHARAHGAHTGLFRERRPVPAGGDYLHTVFQLCITQIQCSK